MKSEVEEMAGRIRAVIEMHAFGAEMMRRRLVQEHGEHEGERRWRAWLTADEWQGPGRKSERGLEAR